MTKSHGKNAFMFVIVTVTLDMLAFGLFIPVLPEYLKMITGKTGEEAVAMGGLLLATFGIMNFLTMSLIGSLSDQIGRRPVLLASNAGLCIDLIVMGLANSFFILLLGRALAGITSATFSTANSYIADVTDPSERGKAYGMLGAAFGIGFVLGPLVGGLLGNIDVRLPFFVAAGIAGLNFLYGFFILPESHAKENRRKFDFARANPFGAFKHFSKLPKVGWFILGAGLFSIAHSVFPATWSWSANIRFNWTAQEIGYSLAAIGVGSAIVQGGLSGYATKTFGPSRTSLFGYSVFLIGMLAYAFISEGWMVYVVIAFGSLGAVTSAAVQQIMTGVTPKDSQGELQGALATVNSLGGLVIGPLLMTQALHTFTAEDAPVRFEGANFFLAALLVSLSAIPFILGVRANAKSLDDMDALVTRKPDEAKEQA